jgi:MFS family permease
MTVRDAFARVRSVAAPLVGDRELRAYYVVFAAVWFAGEAYAQALPLYFREVGISLAVLGVARSAASVANLVAEVPAGLLADRVDRATIAAVSCVGLGVLLVVFPAARTPVLVGGAVVAVALARQFVGSSVTPAISEAVDSERAGLGWGLRDVGIYGGGAAGLVVAGAVTARVGTVSAAFLPGGLAVLLAAGFLWTRVADHAIPGAPRPRTWARSLRAELGGVSPVTDFRAVSNWRVLGVFCVVEAFVTAAGGLSLFLLPAYAADIGFAPAVVLGLFAASNLFGAPLSLVGGVLTDRYSRKWLYVGNYAAETVMLGVFAAAGTGLGAATVGTRPLFVVGLALFVVQTAFEPAVLAYFFDQFDDDEAGRAWSVEGLVARATGIVAPAAGGALYTVDPRLVFLAATVLMGAGTAVALVLPE